MRLTVIVADFAGGGVKTESNNRPQNFQILKGRQNSRIYFKTGLDIRLQMAEK